MKKLINPDEFEKTDAGYQQEANAANLLFVAGIAVGAVMLLTGTTLIIYALKVLFGW